MMGNSGKRRWLRLAAAAVAAGCLVATAGYAVAAQEDGKRDCVKQVGISELTTDWHFANAEGRKPGESLTYYDEIYDTDGTGPTGNIIGHAVGYLTVLYKRPSDGHLITSYRESVVMNDGSSFHTSGLIDRTDMIAGGWAKFQATGTTGVFAGKKGYREWQRVAPGTDNLMARLNHVLCG